MAALDAEFRLATCNSMLRYLLGLEGQPEGTLSYSDVLNSGLDSGLFAGAMGRETAWRSILNMRSRSHLAQGTGRVFVSTLGLGGASV